eukprot:1675089-Alexandrium_andersonii.AAC.1
MLAPEVWCALILIRPLSPSPPRARGTATTRTPPVRRLGVLLHLPPARGSEESCTLEEGGLSLCSCSDPPVRCPGRRPPLAAADCKTSNCDDAAGSL